MAIITIVRKWKSKSKPARPILSINHLAIYYIRRCRHCKRQIIYYIRRRRHCKRQIINFTGSIYFTGSTYIINLTGSIYFTGTAYIIIFTGSIISFTGFINFIGSVYTAYIMILNTRKLNLRNDSPVKYFNKIATALSFKQQYNLWKSSFPSSEKFSLSLGTFDILDHYHQFIDPFIVTFQKHRALLPKTFSYHSRILLKTSSPCSALLACERHQQRSRHY